MLNAAEFAAAMLVEAIDYNLENYSDLDSDDVLFSLEADLSAAIRDENTTRALGLATEVHRYLIANGYADADELPALPLEGK